MIGHRSSIPPWYVSIYLYIYMDVGYKNECANSSI